MNKDDYDHNFWIETDILENFADTEYYKYSNDIFSGLLTAPFKYRFKTGNAPESFFYRDFNVSPFIGWKFRVSSIQPYYIAPFAFAGVTTLSFNSSNNSKILDADLLEIGTGISYGLGLSFRLKKITPGIILGFDHGLGNLGSGFLYKDKPWLSFSLSYDFFKPKPTSEGGQ